MNDLRCVRIHKYFEEYVCEHIGKIEQQISELRRSEETRTNIETSEKMDEMKKYAFFNDGTDGADLTFKIGKNEKGEIVYSDLNELHTLIVAGCCKSGYQEFLDEMIISLLRNSSQDLQFILFDPIVRNWNKFREIHNLQRPIASTPNETLETLKWCVDEIDIRYKKFADVFARNINEYNSRYYHGKIDSCLASDEIHNGKLPHIVIMFDELADYMMNYPERVEDAIIRVAQLGNGAGIHLVVATCRPVEDVITDVIRANLQNSIAFQLDDEDDSKRIIFESGAEMLSRGEMILIKNRKQKLMM